MAETSAIEWCDSTFNPWIGCTKIAPACDHCYAADMARRYKWAEWGNHPRHRTSADQWKQPLRWQKKAAKFFAEHGRRRRVFCASLADVFDNQVDPLWRYDLWLLMLRTPDLDWLLLTKRPQNIEKMLPIFWEDIRSHVWLGTTVEDQKHADVNIPHLLKHDAAVRFISVEPMLGPIDLDVAWHGESALDAECWGECRWCQNGHPALHNCQRGNGDFERGRSGIDWVIAGGESGPLARPSDPAWFISLEAQCRAAGVPFLFKQWGAYVPAPAGLSEHDAFAWAERNNHGRLGRASEHWGSTSRQPSEWAIMSDDRYMFPTAKARAGRLLEGVEHNGFPVMP